MVPTNALRVKVSKESIPNLYRLLIDSCAPKEYILKIGEIDSVTPTVVRALEQLKTLCHPDHFTGHKDVSQFIFVGF